MRKLITILIVALTPLPLHAATVYKWVDEDGMVHFSDEKPPAGRHGDRISIGAGEDAAGGRRKTPVDKRSPPKAEQRPLKASTQGSQAKADTAYRRRKCRRATDTLAHLQAAPDADVQKAQRLAAEKVVRRDIARWCDS